MALGDGVLYGLRYRSFKGEERHHRFVRLMRIALPAVAIFLVAIVLIWPVVYDGQPGFTLAFSQLDDFDDTLRMERPQFVGSDGQDRRFSVEAQSAYQAAVDDENVYLEGISADVSSDAEFWIALDAPSGIFRRETDVLELAGQVNVFSSLGYEVHGRAFRVNLKEGTVVADTRVFGQGPLGAFEAAEMHVDVEGGSFELSGGVRMMIYPRAID